MHHWLLISKAIDFFLQETVVLEVDSVHLIILLQPPKSAIAPSQLQNTARNVCCISYVCQKKTQASVKLHIPKMN